MFRILTGSSRQPRTNQPVLKVGKSDSAYMSGALIDELQAKDGDYLQVAMNDSSEVIYVRATANPANSKKITFKDKGGKMSYQFACGSYLNEGLQRGVYQATGKTERHENAVWHVLRKIG